MKRAHDRPGVALLDQCRLSIHGYIQAAIACADDEQYTHQRQHIGGQARQDDRQTEANQHHSGHAAAADATNQPADYRLGHQRPGCQT
jgi:hypothetical protein